MNVRMLKLVTGEDVIGNVSRNGGKYIVKKPATLQFGPGPDGQIQVGIAPYPPLGEEKGEIDIPASSVVLEYAPKLEISNIYNQAFGSGLIVANQLPQLITE